jgi:cyclohexanecarboxylate-CoA ligase
MLPNWVEFAALMFAIAQIGAIYSGIPAAYGQREATFMVRRVRSRVMVIPDAYRNRDYVDLARLIYREAPDLQHVVVLGDAPDEAGFLPFSTLASAEPVVLPEITPGSLVHVGFTSGTTGEPKGVMNTHQTLDAVLFRFIEHHGTDLLNDRLVNLIASPMGHHTGFLWGVLFTTLLQGRGVSARRPSCRTCCRRISARAAFRCTPWRDRPSPAVCPARPAPGSMPSFVPPGA